MARARKKRKKAKKSPGRRKTQTRRRVTRSDPAKPPHN
jgi:hypothetical protein